MDKYERLNSLVKTLHSIMEPHLFKPATITSTNTVLVLVDIQNSLKSKHYEEMLRMFGWNAKEFAEELKQVDEYVNNTVSNISKLLKKCREKKITVIHAKLEAYLSDARDTGNLHKKTGMLSYPGSYDTQILTEVQPVDGEIVLKKTCSGICVGTDIDRIMRNMNIENVIVTGFYTDQCISSSVRDLADIGYNVVLPEDAVAALSPERHENAMESLRVYAYIESTESLLNRI